MNLKNFEMPKGVVVDKKTLTDKYAKFDVRPLERGWGHTLGNALRRVILNSLEGAAITTVKIDGVSHEFATIDGVYEDVTHIILNLKKVLFKVTTLKPFTCTLKVSGQKDVFAGDIKVPAGVEILNPDHYICNLDNGKLNAEFEVEVGRRYRPADQNKKEDLPVGVIPIDSLFSPIEKVKYAVKDDARVGDQTDYDGLVLEIWTDGRITPIQALVQSAELLSKHVGFFSAVEEPVYLTPDPDEEATQELVSETAEVNEEIARTPLPGKKKSGAKGGEIESAED